VEGTFTLVTFPPELASDPGVVYVETRVRGIYYEDPAEILLYRQVLTACRCRRSRRRSPLQ
jgi:hypothetical protein